MEISGLEREDHWDYPQPALREALLNAVIHRDYSYGGSIIINVNKKEIEFISIGGLASGNFKRGYSEWNFFIQKSKTCGNLSSAALY